MNISRHWTLLAGVLVFSVLGPRSASANSKYLNVQGTLTDTSGNPLTGNQTITFRLYTSSTAAVGSAIWTESQTVTLSTGLFNVTLGTVTALDSLSFSQLYYLGIQVAGDANELSPRQVLGASAYAQGSLGNFSVGSNLIINSGATPATNLDDNGNAQFGSGATKSTFSVTGSLTMASGTNIWSPSTGLYRSPALTGWLLRLTDTANNPYSFGFYYNGNTNAFSWTSGGYPMGINTTAPANNSTLQIVSSATPTGYALRVTSQNLTTDLFLVGGNGSVIVPSTFTALGQDSSGYSMNASSSVKTGGCYYFSDGTKQCTGGGAVLSATQTFSGADTFASSATAGPTIYTTTATTGPGAIAGYPGVYVNGWMIVASTNPSNAGNIFITGLQAEKIYRLTFRFILNTSNADLRFRFNNDSTAGNYQWAANAADSFPENLTAGSASADGINANSSANIKAGEAVVGYMQFAGWPGQAKTTAFGQASYVDASARYEVSNSAGKYTGGSPTSLTIFPSAGNLSGYVYLEQLIAPLP